MKTLARLSILAIALTFSIESLASTYEAVYIHQYTNSKGQKKSVRDIVSSDRSTLVLLWANWCEPCKKELKWLSKTAGKSTDLNIVTINVDDASDQANAQQFLQSIESSWPSLFDVDGEQFYNYHQSGQLPLVLHFDPNGRLLHRYGHFTDKELKQVQDTKTSTSAMTEKSGIAVANRLRYREQVVPGLDDQKVVAERLNVAYSAEFFDLSLNYDQLHQTKDNGDWQTFEDEIGFSFAEFRWAIDEDQLVTTRVGGKNLMIANGLNFAARTNRDLNENLFVAGGFVDYKNSMIHLGVFYGRLRNNLFPAIINPAQDLSETLPREVVSGAELKVSQFGMDWLKF